MRDLRQTLGNIGRAALELVWPKQVNCQGCGDVSGADREYLCVVRAMRAAVGRTARAGKPALLGLRHSGGSQVCLR